MKGGILYRARLKEPGGTAVRQLHYRDSNFPDRPGWKEVIAAGGPGIRLIEGYDQPGENASTARSSVDT
jgi:hypothetical protein